MLAVIKNGEILAWSDRWKEESYRDHRILAIPSLRLTQEAALNILSKMGYADVFHKAKICTKAPALDPFLVIHANFSLYRTGESAIDDIAVLVLGEGDMPPLPETLGQATKLLEAANEESRVQTRSDEDGGRTRGRPL